MNKYRKRPVIIDAFHWAGDNGDDLVKWVTAFGQNTSGTDVKVVGNEVIIGTKEGSMRCPAGNWIIRGIVGEFYSCAPEIFAATYDTLEAPVASSVGNEPKHVFESQCTPQLVQMAKKMYMAYCENSDNKNFRGEECPAWEALPTNIRSHWCSAAVVALPHLNVR